MTFAQTVVEIVVARGDLAHLALCLWAGTASLLCAAMLREIAAANARFDAFVRELALFNRRHGAGPGDAP